MNLDGLYRMQGMLFSLMILGAFLKKKGIITDGCFFLYTKFKEIVTLTESSKSPASIAKSNKQ